MNRFDSLLKKLIVSKFSWIWWRLAVTFCQLYRSSHQRCSMQKGVLRNLTKLTGKHLCQTLFFNKVAGLRPATLLKKRLWHRYFPVNFAKFLRTPFLQNTCGSLLLIVYPACEKNPLFCVQIIWCSSYSKFSTDKYLPKTKNISIKLIRE